MKATVLIASVIMSLRPRLFDAISPYALVEAIVERYNFRSSPTPEQLATAPANFHFGKIERDGKTIIVEQLLVTYMEARVTSVGATTKTSTGDSMFFLTDLLNWAHEKFGIDKTRQFPDFFHSMLELEFERSLIRFEDFRPIGQAITNLVRGYGFKASDFELSGIQISLDPTTQVLPNLTPFSLERRAGASFRENRYFSQAPLRTDDHMWVISEIERLFSDATSAS